MAIEYAAKTVRIYGAKEGVQEAIETLHYALDACEGADFLYVIEDAEIAPKEVAETRYNYLHEDE